MLSLLIMFAINIFGAFYCYLLIAGKIKIGGLFTGYSIITVLPVILMIVIPLGVLDAIIILLRIGSSFKENIGAITLLIIILEILIISILSLIRLNLFPVCYFTKEADESKKSLILDSGKRLLSYCIYGNFIYSVFFLTGILYFISKNHATLGYILMHPIDTIGYLLVTVLMMIFMPFMTLPFYFYATIGFVVVTGFILMFSIIIIMSMNGVIRISYGSKHMRKKCLLYIGLMLFPILNVFCMIKLSKLAKIELCSTFVN